MHTHILVFIYLLFFQFVIAFLLSNYVIMISFLLNLRHGKGEMISKVLEWPEIGHGAPTPSTGTVGLLCK